VFYPTTNKQNNSTVVEGKEICFLLIERVKSAPHVTVSAADCYDRKDRLNVTEQTDDDDDDDDDDDEIANVNANYYTNDSSLFQEGGGFSALHG